MPVKVATHVPAALLNDEPDFGISNGEGEEHHPSQVVEVIPGEAAAWGLIHPLLGTNKILLAARIHDGSKVKT